MLAAGTAQAGKLVYIFDASGSMWGQIDGKPKIEIARDALSQLVRTIPSGTDVGLVAYGHRVKGDCTDIETLVPTGPLNADALTSAVAGINPKGKTPMADSVRLVADQLKAGGQGGSIILISDGIETCDPDPCAAVRDLKQAGIDFTLHVIGFDVSGETEAQLQCMAEAGGGEYFPARNAADFGVSVKEVQELAVDNLLVSATRNGKPLAVDVHVYPAGSDTEAASRFSTERDPANFNLEPGLYDVRIVDAWGQEDNPEQTVAGVEVTKGQAKEVSVDFGGGKLEVWAYRNGVPFAAYVLVTDSQGGENYKQTYEDQGAVYELASGTYNVIVRDEWGTKAVIDLGQVTIASDTVKKEAHFDSATLEVWAYRNGVPFAAYVLLTDSQGGENNKQTYEDQGAVYELLAGTYNVKVKDEWGTGAIIDLGQVPIASDPVKLEAYFDAATLEVWAYRGGKPYVADVLVEGASGWHEYRQTYEADPARFEVMPGQYHVTVKDEWGDGRVIDLGRVTVTKDGLSLEATFD